MGKWGPPKWQEENEDLQTFFLKKSPKVHKMNFFLETKTIIKINGQNHHMEDNKEGQNEIQRPHPPIEKKNEDPQNEKKRIEHSWTKKQTEN